MPENIPHFDLAELDAKRQAFNEAEDFKSLQELAQQILATHPTGRLLALAHICEGNAIRWGAKDYEAELSKYNLAIKADNTYTIAYNNKVNALYDLKRYDEVIECIDKVIKLNPKDSQTYNKKGIVLGILNRYEDAIKCFEKNIKLAPNDAAAYSFKGHALNDLTHYNKAIKWLDKAIALDPKNAYSYNQKGRALSNLRRYKEAIECYDNAIGIDPKNAPAYSNKGNTLSRLERYDEAIECFDNAIEIDPEYAFAYNGKGIVLDDLKRYEEAIDAYNKAIKIDPDDAISYYNKSIVLNNLGRYEEAISCYQAALNTKKCDFIGDIWRGIALCYRDLKDYSNAILYLEKAAKAYRAAGEEDSALVAEDLNETLSNFLRATNEGQEGLAQLYYSATQIEKSPTVRPMDPTSQPSTEDKSNALKAIENAVIKKSTATDIYGERELASFGNWLVCLRGWSSSTNIISLAHPEFYSNAKCCGGGFFLTWNSKIHIIDPGTDFLATFCSFDELPLNKNLPPHILQVYSVQTTHFHPDHAGDLDAIVQLDKDVAKNHHRVLRFNLDENTFNKHASQSSLLHQRSGRKRVDVYMSQAGDDIPLDDDHCKLHVFKVDHGPEAPSACGFNFSLNCEKTQERNVGFTGDTKWLETLGTNLKQSDVIVCNFSATRDADLSEKDGKKDHLGIMGLLNLINATAAKIYVVTEFWGQLGDIRVPVVKHLLERVIQDGKRSDNMPVILPADIGLIIDVENLTVMCSHCKKFFSPEKIIAISIAPSFGKILYLCPLHVTGSHIQ